ncbi:MAG: PilW family protein [Vicinamibacteria bacterium]
MARATDVRRPVRRNPGHSPAGACGPVRRSPRAVLAGEGGFTLPELLVSLTLTLIVLGGALTALQDANRASQTGVALSEVNQNLRVGMNLLIRDLLQAGQGIPTGGIPLPTGVGAESIPRPSPEGAALTFPADWTTLPAVSPGPALGAVVNGVPTDLVTLLVADAALDLNSEPFTFLSADGGLVDVPATLPIDDGATGVRPGDLIMLTNARGNAIQEVTAVIGQRIVFGDEPPSRLNQPGAAQGSVLHLRNTNGTWPPTTGTRIQMITYYVATAASGVPILMRQANYGEPRMVAMGVENLQLSFDLVDGVTNPTNVKSPESPNTPHQIRKANLFGAARSAAEAPGPGRHVYARMSTQVSLRSLAFVDRYR